MIQLCNELGEARELVEDLVRQACQQTDGTLDSMCMSTYEEALEYLVRCGRVEIVRHVGRRILARWKADA